jgi:hypothetical protein
MNVCTPSLAVMKQRACIVLALGCVAVACESVGTIGRATGVDEDVAAGTSSSSGDAEVVDASTESSGDDEVPTTSGDRVPESGGDEATETSELDSSTGDVGTFMSDTGTESGYGDEPCCAATVEPGCGDVATQSCVCEIDPYCCEMAWDEACVNTSLLSGCSMCPMAKEPEQLDCCVANATAGCTDTPVQDCVCAMDPYCCAQEWDQTCVDKIDELGCGTCQ